MNNLGLRQINTLRQITNITVKIFKDESEEYRVTVWINSRIDNKQTYFTDDKKDALLTSKDMAKRLESKGNTVVKINKTITRVEGY